MIIEQRIIGNWTVGTSKADDVVFIRDVVVIRAEMTRLQQDMGNINNRVKYVDTILPTT